MDLNHLQIVLRISVCVCVWQCQQGSQCVICDHVAWPSALYNHKQMKAGQLHSIISKRSRPGKCIHALVSG